jgi:LuxR family transcriptional regulator, glucitol operon activator
LRKNYEEAINLYKAANQISTMYGGEKTIEAYFNLGLAYVNCDEFEKAEAAFDNILYDKNKANQIEVWQQISTIKNHS